MLRALEYEVPAKMREAEKDGLGRGSAGESLMLTATGCSKFHWRSFGRQTAMGAPARTAALMQIIGWQAV
jgi:hypothetical protein